MLSDLRTIVAKTIDIKNKAFQSETKFAEDLGANYLDMAEIGMAIEDKYNIEILSERKAIYVKTVEELMNVIEEKVKENI